MEIKISNDTTGPQTLRINRTPKNCSFQAEITVFNYVDKETNQYVFFAPAFEVSAYGATAKDAHKMLEFSLDDFFNHLASLSKKALEYELLRLGWSHHKLKNKEYSKSYIDVSGELKDFAVGNKVEQGVLTF